jgi:hypothetical protein
MQALSWQESLQAEAIQEIINGTPFENPKDITDLKVIVWSNQVLNWTGEITKEPLAKDRVKKLASEALLFKAREVAEVFFGQLYFHNIKLPSQLIRIMQDRLPANHESSFSAEEDFVIVDRADTFSNRSDLINSWMGNPSLVLTQAKIDSILSFLREEQ